MTKLTPLLAGRIREYRSITRCSVSAAARKFGLDWHTCRSALDERYPNASHVYRGVRVGVAKRRAIVQRLALRRTRKANHEFCVFPSACAIRDELMLRGFVTSKSGVLRDLHACGFESRVRKRVPVRDPDVHKKRYKFACELLRKPDSYLRSIVFSDEHKCSTNDYTHRRQWVRQGDSVLSRERKRIQNVPNLQMWGAIGVGYKSALVLLPQTKRDEENEKKAFRMDSEWYVRSCLSKLCNFQGRVFMHDGARPHVATRVSDYLRRKGVKQLENWPPYSPDLNVIEELWPIVNIRIGAQHPTTLPELMSAVHFAWDSITQKEIDAFCLSFRTKLELCRAQKGQC